MTSDPTTIHLITHNHWDREWIFTARYANRWLPTFFNNLLAMLEKEPDYRFVLDGQMLIIEDYLQQLSSDEVAARERDIRKYVNSGQLLIGPAYLQPDWSLVSGEALVRNLLIGAQMARRYGDTMKVGWLLDNFGQIGQAPQIFGGFDIQGVFLWRGVELPAEETKTEFWWEAPNGARILSVHLLDSYRNAMVLGRTRDISQERILSHAEVLLRFASTPNVLLMNGYEQVPEPDDVLPIIAEVNQAIEPDMHCTQSTPPAYLQAIRSHDPELPVLKGYLYSGRYAPILKGVYSSRGYLNQQNDHCQRELERWAEPFNTFAWALGAEYPEERLERAWKSLLLNHTHDDLCGCCIDPIARDMEGRFADVGRMGALTTSRSLRAITETIDTSKGNGAALVVFNPSSRPRRETAGISMELPEEMAEFHIHDSHGNVIPHQLVHRIGRKVDIYMWTKRAIPAVGYRTYYVDAGTKQAPPYPQVTASTDNTMENEFLRVKINDDGTLTIRDKIRDHVYENVGFFEDGGDAGDTYDYSYPERDSVISSLGQKAKVAMEIAGPLMARFRVEVQLNLPRGLAEDRKSRQRKTRNLPIVSFVELSADARHVEIRTTIHNVVKDHRLRLLFPTGLQCDHSHAGMPYDVAQFPLRDALDAGDVPEQLQDLMLAGRYTEPVNTRPFQHFISLASEKRSFTVFSRGLNEYEVLLDKHTIALTLLRGVGWLARSDLPLREGDVGPHIFTPEAQCLGKHTFEYAIFPHGGELSLANPPFESDRHTLRFRVVQSDAHDGRLPDELSFMSWVGEEPQGALKLTALKRSEEGDGVIVRFYNALDRPAKAHLKLGGQIARVWRANMAEENQEEIAIKNGALPVAVQGKEIITLKAKLKPRRLVEDFGTRSTRLLPPLEPDTRLPPTESPPHLTAEEVAQEQKRAEQLLAALLAIRSEADNLDDEIRQKEDPGVLLLALLQRLRGREATLARQHYEARISASLNQQLLITNQMELELDAIGQKLNWARVSKRVSEFLIHYYDSLAKRSA